MDDRSIESQRNYEYCFLYCGDWEGFRSFWLVMVESGVTKLFRLAFGSIRPRAA